MKGQNNEIGKKKKTFKLRWKINTDDRECDKDEM